MNLILLREVVKELQKLLNVGFQVASTVTILEEPEFKEVLVFLLDTLY